MSDEEMQRGGRFKIASFNTRFTSTKSLRKQKEKHAGQKVDGCLRKREKKSGKKTMRGRPERRARSIVLLLNISHLDKRRGSARQEVEDGGVQEKKGSQLAFIS